MSERSHESNHPKIDKRLSFELPQVIEVPYPSVSIGDLKETLTTTATFRQAEIEDFESILNSIKQEHAPHESNFYYVPASSIAHHLEHSAMREIEQSEGDTGVVHLDKAIGLQQDAHPHVARLNLSRNPQNRLIPRTGTSETAEEQIDAIKEWVRQNNLQEVILIDDVVAFGDTLPTIIDLLRDDIDDVNFRVQVGLASSGGIWRGIETIRERAGIETEYLTKIVASPQIEGGSRGMAVPVSRDFTLFGGKASQDPSGRHLSHPYFLPFSKPIPSFIRSERIIEASIDFLNFSEFLVNKIEANTGREYTLGDLRRQNFGIPSSSLACLREVMEVPTDETTLRDFIDYSRSILHTYENEIIEECRG